MRRAGRFLLLLLAVVLIFLIFRDEETDPRSVAVPVSDSGSRDPMSRGERGVHRTSSYGAGDKRPQKFSPGETAKRSGTWTDAPTRLEILVVDEETQAPLPDASVQVVRVWSQSNESSGVTGPDGRASFELDAGQYWLWANHPEYIPKRVGLAADGSESQRTIGLMAKDPPGSLVTGSVHDQAGRAVPGALVSLDIPFVMGNHTPSDPLEPPIAPIQVRNWHARKMRLPGYVQTDETGAFSLEVPEGNYQLHVLSLPHDLYEDTVQVPTPGPLEIVLTELGNLVRLSGRVSNEDGIPLSGASVNLSISTKSEALGFADATTGSDGFFEFVSPPGIAGLEIKFKEHETYRKTHEMTQDTEIFPVLKKYEKYRSFTVKVYDSKGRIVEDPFVIGTALESGKGVVSPVAGNIARSKQPHTYQAAEYPFRIYATALHVGLGITEAKVIRSYQANIDLRVRSGGRIEGNVADSDGNPVRDFTIVLRKDGFDLGIFRSFSQEGRFNLEGIPPGLYSLSFHSRPEPDWTKEAGKVDQELATVRPKLVMIQNNRTSFLDVVLRPQGWVKTAGQRGGRLESDPELRTVN